MSPRPAGVWGGLWLLLSVATMLCWGTSSFMYGVIAERGLPGANLSAIFVVWLTGGCLGSVWAAQLVASHGLAGLAVPRAGVLGICVGSGLAGALGSLALTLAMAADPASKGPIAAMLPIQGVFVAALTRLFLGEEVTRGQLLGMAVAIGGLVVMVAAEMGGASLHGMGYGMLCALLFATSNVLLRCALATGCDAPVVNVIVMLTSGVLGVASFAATYACGRGLQGVDGARAWLVLCAAAGGVLGCAGMLTIVKAFEAGGTTGVVATIANANAVVVFLLDLAFFNPDINIAKIGGMVVVLLGVSILALVPTPAAEPRRAPCEAELGESPLKP